MLAPKPKPGDTVLIRACVTSVAENGSALFAHIPALGSGVHPVLFSVQHVVSIESPPLQPGDHVLWQSHEWEIAAIDNNKAWIKTDGLNRITLISELTKSPETP